MQSEKFFLWNYRTQRRKKIVKWTTHGLISRRIESIQILQHWSAAKATFLNKSRCGLHVASAHGFLHGFQSHRSVLCILRENLKIHWDCMLKKWDFQIECVFFAWEKATLLIPPSLHGIVEPNNWTQSRSKFPSWVR